MSQAKKDKSRKSNLEAYKQKQKLKNQIMSENQVPQPAPIRQVPVWKSSEILEITGLEFEAIYNYINSVQGAYAAMQSVMNRNILSGKVNIDFEKLNDTQSAYVPMSDEEKAPHLAEVQATLDALRKQSSGVVSEVVSASDEPQADPEVPTRPNLIVVP